MSLPYLGAWHSNLVDGFLPWKLGGSLVYQSCSGRLSNNSLTPRQNHTITATASARQDQDTAITEVASGWHIEYYSTVSSWWDQPVPAAFAGTSPNSRCVLFEWHWLKGFIVWMRFADLANQSFILKMIRHLKRNKAQSDKDSFCAKQTNSR